MSRLKLAAVALAFLSLAGCEAAPLTAPNGSSIFLQANPTFVIANGGISVVTAVVTEPAGTFVPDGTEVFFFTNLGRIDQTGKTVRGIARVNFVSDSRSGHATVTAISGQAPGGTNPSVEIAIGSALPNRVSRHRRPAADHVAAQRPLGRDGVRRVRQPGAERAGLLHDRAARWSRRRSTAAARCSTRTPTARCRDTLRTQAPIGLGQKTVTVTATTANGITGTVTVFID